MVEFVLESGVAKSLVLIKTPALPADGLCLKGRKKIGIYLTLYN